MEYQSNRKFQINAATNTGWTSLAAANHQGHRHVESLLRQKAALSSREVKQLSEHPL
jgi:ureidoglycolate hydrolase